MIGYLRSAVAGLRANQMQMDVISNNLSNLNTPGFRRARADFEDFLYRAVQPVAAQPLTARQIGAGVGVAGMTEFFDQGAFHRTDNPLDLAISGDGFFQVLLPDGRTVYTRDGQFQRDLEGRLVTADGFLIAPGIIVPSGAETVEVDESGAVLARMAGSGEYQMIGQLEFARFINPGGLLAIGDNRYAATEASGPAFVGSAADIGISVAAGVLEGSNVNMGDEITSLITAQRAYGLSATAFQTIDEMIGLVTNLRR